MQFDQLKCREFISGAAAYLLAGRAQQREKMRRICWRPDPRGDSNRRAGDCHDATGMARHDPE